MTNHRIDCHDNPESAVRPSSIHDLTERTEYEAWLLEAVYTITDRGLTVTEGDGLVYPPDGGDPAQSYLGRGELVSGDWRPGFLEVGAPLVFATAFKLLDMLIEWVLVENGKSPPNKWYPFKRKMKDVADVNAPVLFPPLVESRPWLRERLIALYDQLEPLRGTVIHDRHFTSIGGALQVSRSRGGVGLPVTLRPEDLRNLALVFVSVLRYVEGTWAMDSFHEKRVRKVLDELANLHGQPIMGQMPPVYLTVRVHVVDEDPVQCDMGRIRRDVARLYAGQDVVYGLRIVLVSRDGIRMSAYLITWDQLQDPGTRFSKTRLELAGYSVAPPTDADPAALARAMGLLPREW